MKTDFLILGSGIAGLSLALKLSELGEVTILTKKGITSGSTGLAQGGIAGVTNPEEDSSENHFHDTMKAGSYHNDEAAVRLVVENGEKALQDLQKWGVEFDFSLHREGGHTYARIFHVADETGRVVQEVLADEVLRNSKIQVIEDAFAVDLLMKENVVRGVCFFHDDTNKTCLAKRIILATGGAGQIFSKTTNPAIITGDGIAMATRAGAELKDMEFVQFHPTALDMPRDPLFLLSEALRGAGAKIVDKDGKQFVDELSPRDVVAQSIFLKKKEGEKVFLDFRHESERVLEQKFPMIFENLLSFGFNLSQDLVPITPAAHFLCGGVATNVKGETNIQHLFALGETACTGVHGANRLASNSLLEGVVFADQISQYFFQSIEKIQTEELPKREDLERVEFQENTSNDAMICQKIQKLMQEYVGVLRDPKEMQKTEKILEILKPEGTEIKNLLLIAKKVTLAAINRKESLGCHFVVS